jgi:hypothetical protein
MYLIVSKKLTTPIRSDHPHPAFDRASVQAIVNSPSSSGTLYHVTLDDVARDAYVSDKTRQGYTCHIFGYSDSYRTIQTTHSVRIAG